MVPRLDPYDRYVVIAIDVGNSTVKVARVVDGMVGPISRLRTSDDPDLDVLSRILVTDRGVSEPVALVSVVPAWSAAIAQAVARISPDRPPVVASHGTIPIPVSVKAPEAVGADRLLGAWAARDLVGAPCIVVDVGTATTIDVVDPDGAFVGGAILPGPALAIRSLARGTALLPQVPLVPPERVIGRDTLEAIASGTLVGHREAIGGLIQRMTEELRGGIRPWVVLTGGDAGVLGTPEWAERVEPDLLLLGLGALAERLSADEHVGAGR
jgi:type III pantothenate kinase